MQIEAILFDLFDTLVLIRHNEAYYEPCLRKAHEFLTKNGVNVSFEVFSRVYFDVRDKFYSESRKTLEEPHFNVRISQTLQKLGYNLAASDIIVAGTTNAFANEFMRYIDVDKNAFEILKKLKTKYKLALVSNFAIPECVWNLLDRFNLKSFFDVIVISGEINQRKPSPKIFEKALQSLQVKASKTVFIGDTPDLDVIGPKNIGINTILIERKPTKEKTNMKPDKTITDLTEILAILEHWPKNNNTY